MSESDHSASASVVASAASQAEAAVQCPFCAENGFDLPGLKIHFQSGWCAPYEAINTDYPDCSGNPADCPENEGRGCCKNA